MFLNHFDPADVSPDVMIDREDDLRWLLENFEGYFDAIEQRKVTDTARRIACMTGDKGMGKSILAGRLVHELRKKYSASTLFVSVDCRGINGARGLVASIASGLLNEISTFESVAAVGGRPFPDWLTKLAAGLSTVAHADEATSKTLHQQLSVHKATLKLGGQQMLRTLKAEFDISLEREKREVEGLETAIKFDVDRLLMLTTKLFQDIRTAGWRVFLLVDNVDELQQDYWNEEARNNAQATVKRMLTLAEAPIAMLLCMRTYYQAILPRAVGVPRQLGKLPVERLLEIVDYRVNLDTDAMQHALRSAPARAMIDTLARRAATPLALINWVKWAAESAQGFGGPIEAHAEQWRGARYTDYVNVVEKTLALFAAKRAEGGDAVSQKELLAAIDGDTDGLRYIQETELILPRDFWSPTHFVLDPSTAWIAGQR